MISRNLTNNLKSETFFPEILYKYFLLLLSETTDFHSWSLFPSNVARLSLTA